MIQMIGFVGMINSMLFLLIELVWAESIKELALKNSETNLLLLIVMGGFVISIAISVLSSLHFAPTQMSFDTLINEGYDKETVFLTGNTVVDALLAVLEVAGTKESDYFKKVSKGILVTAHRRENDGDSPR